MFINIIITIIIITVLCCQACPSLIVAQPGGGDSFLFHPSRIPFLNVVWRWSPFASASGSVALADLLLFLCITLLNNNTYFIVICYCSIHVSTKSTR